MQQRQAAGAAQATAASWYLLHDDRQFGPLSERELLLLAERGGLKADDLLWRSGFDEWKPVSAVCGTTAPAPLPACDAAPVQDAVSLPRDATSGDEGKTGKRSLKARLYEELQKFLVMFAYLWLVFFVFLLHEWIVLADNHIGFRFYGLAAINALVLSKIMLIAEGMRFAERFRDKALIVPIVYKSLMFSVLLVAAYVVEEIAIGVFHGQSVAASIPLLGGGFIGTLCVTVLLFVALVPFFAFKEMARAIGKAEFRALMFGPARRVERDTPNPSAVLTPAE
jgi:hypothetical protein